MHLSTPSPPDYGRIEFILLVAAVMMIAAFAIDSMLPALPQIGDTLGISNENDRPIIISVFMAGFAAMQLFAGTLTDRFGRQMPLRFGMILFAISSMVCAESQSFEMLLAARFVQGMSAGSCQVVIRAVVRDRFAGRDMAQVMSFAGMIFMAAPILAPTLGQLILNIADWRWIFRGLGLIGLLVWCWLQWRIKETLPPDRRTLINLAEIKRAARIVASDRMSVGYTFAIALVQCGLFAFLLSIQQIFEFSFKRPDFLPTGFAIMAVGMAVASLFNATVVQRFGMRKIGHVALMFYIVIAGLHLLIALSGVESMALFIALQTIMMTGHSMAMGNFSAMAMEKMGDVAGLATSLQGTISTVIGLSLGTAIGHAFNGTTVPLCLAYFGFGVAALIIIFITEGGQFFTPRQTISKG